MLQFSPISRVVKDDLKLFCDVYIMFCHVSDPNLGVGGADCFHPKWTVDSSYLWNVHCFQIRWCICHSVGIGIKGSSRNRVNAAMNLVSIVAGCSQRQKVWIGTSMIYTTKRLPFTTNYKEYKGFLQSRISD